MRRGLTLFVVALALAAVGCGTSSDGSGPVRDAANESVDVSSAPDPSPEAQAEVLDAPRLETEAVLPEADLPEPDLSDLSDVALAESEPDVAEVYPPELDATEPDVVEVETELEVPGPEVVEPAPDVVEAGVPEIEAAPEVPSPDVAELTPEANEVAPEVTVPPSVYPDFAAARFDGVPLPKRVPGIRLFLSYTGDDGDATTCGAVTWRLGNRVVLSGTYPDGVGRGRLTGATLFVDVDEHDPDADVYPTLDGELRPYPFVVDVLDAAHQRLWRGRLREPIQIREYVARALEDKAGLEFSPLVGPLVSSVLDADLEALSIVVPDLPGARFVRFSRDLTFDERLALAADPSCPLDPNAPFVIPSDAGQGPLAEADLATLPEVPLSTLAGFTSEIEVTRLAGTVDPAEALNVAILADGFLAADKAAFEVHAAAVAEALLGLEPFAAFSGRLNVWRIWTPSAEAGVSYDCACDFYGAPGACTKPTPACKDGLRDTMYGSDFVIRSVFKLLGQTPEPGADRMIVPLRLARVALAMSLSAADGTPVSADAAFVLANDPKEAAFGLFYAALTTGFTTTDGEAYLGEVATHEFGHAFGLLGDEYHAASDICQVFDLTPLFPNFSPITADAEGLAWAPWVTLEGPYPNTEDQGTSDAVGCFVPAPGGGQCVDLQGQSLVCRASKTCKMKTNEGAFCPVCRDHVMKRIFRRVDLLVDPLFTITETGPTAFRLEAALSEPGVTASWRVDDVLVQQTPSYAPLDLDVAAFAPGMHEVTLEVSHPSAGARLWADALRERLSATIIVP